MTTREASDLSKRVAVEYKAALQRAGKNVKDVERATGIPYRTLMSKLGGRSDLTVADLFTICAPFGFEPGDVLAEAERHMPAGYLENLTVSPRAATVTRIHETDWDSYEGAKAADYDAEAETDEPDQP